MRRHRTNSSARGKVIRRRSVIDAGDIDAFLHATSGKKMRSVRMCINAIGGRLITMILSQQVCGQFQIS